MTATRSLMSRQLRKLLNKTQEFFRWLKFAGNTIANFPAIWRYRDETFRQFYQLGNQALPLVILATVFVSIVLSLETGKKLEPFGAKLMLGRVVVIAVLRELGPVITGLMMAGRVGAKIVSEIGNMVLTEQVDALRAYGTNPIRRLIVPRVFAALAVMLPLTIISDAIGIIGGSFSAIVLLDVDFQFFWLSVQQGPSLKDLTVGIIKPPFFGLLIGTISAYLGYNLRGGSEGMGQAATRTVMLTSIGVLLMDFILTIIIISFF
ncbi:MAG: ABC transporter permease [candidate division KSB1 bacterium]|nr:ABC transporter permease [candidate division KSB1 bacterium]